jgi:hypothetical protein
VPLASLALLGLLLGPPSAEPARLQLDWQAPSQCPSSTHVEARVAALLGERVREGATIAARVQVRARGRRFEATLELRSGDDPPGRRTLADPDCSELAEGVALILALAVDPELALGPTLPDEPDDDAHETGIAGLGESHQRELALRVGELALRMHELPPREPSRPPHIDPPLAPARPTRSLAYGLALLGGAGMRALPDASVRMHAQLFVAGPHYRIEVGLASMLPRRIADARYEAWALELAGCGVPRVGVVELPLCARVELGAMRGESLGPLGRQALAPWLVATPGLGVIVRPRATRGFLGVIVRADAILPLTRPAFATDEGALLLRVGFGAQVLVGVELRIPLRERTRTRPGSRAMLDDQPGGHPPAMPRRSE